MPKLEIRLEADRLEVAKILVRNGYTVRQTREKIEGKRSYKDLLEYSKPKTKAGDDDE